MSPKTTINWLFNGIWCYLFIACFDWKICFFQQTAVYYILQCCCLIFNGRLSSNLFQHGKQNDQSLVLIRVWHISFCTLSLPRERTSHKRYIFKLFWHFPRNIFVFFRMLMEFFQSFCWWCFWHILYRARFAPNNWSI